MASFCEHVNTHSNFLAGWGTLKAGCIPKQWKLQLNLNSTQNLGSTATEQNTCSHMAQCAPRTPYHNCNAIGGKVGNSTEKQLGMPISCELSSRPVVQLTMERKYLEERNILFVQLIGQEPCLHDRSSPHYSRRDKIDLAWGRIAQEMKRKQRRKRGESSVSTTR
jgi:hypothetical protein